jgi:hypothetical protein
MNIATVVEGPTDRIVLEAVLDRLLPGEPSSAVPGFDVTPVDYDLDKLLSRSEDALSADQ